MYGFFSSFLKPLTAAWYQTQIACWRLIPLLDDKHCQLPFPPPSPSQRYAQSFELLTLASTTEIPKTGGIASLTSYASKEKNCIVPNHSALLHTAV